MSRVLVPLDGSAFSTSILPDALELAGSGGELILMHDASRPVYDDVDLSPEAQAVAESETYLASVAESLRDTGVGVRKETFVMGDPARAVSEAVEIFNPDFIACATHARGGIDGIVRPSVAWQLLGESSTPVMFRRFPQREPLRSVRAPLPPKILLPLDGSPASEQAIPIALRLADRLGARVVVARVVPAAIPPLGTKPFRAPQQPVSEGELAARDYLSAITTPTIGSGYGAVLIGPAVARLADAVHDFSISIVVMASHHRTGIAKVVLGSVTQGLLQRVEVPVIVVPAVQWEAEALLAPVHARAPALAPA